MKEIKEDLIELLEFPDKEKIIIIKSYNDLILNCKNCLTDQDKLLLKKALIFSSQVHKNQYISKGKPYLLHPLNVSKIVSDEIGLGVNSMVSAFLHEIYDKGEIDEKQIIKEFGKTINSIVQGLSKISGLDFRNTAIHAENFRKLILTMASDIRVILIKIADRLHNMRTLDTKTPERQFKMALETSYLYAPLAHRIGMYNIKSELEDISLKYLDKETYNYIDQKLKDTKLKRERYIREFIKPIKTNLEKEGIKFEIKRRTKSISSIWNKMKKQDVDFDGIFDIYAIRIILESSIEKEKETCWKVYSIVSDIYQPNP
ncbi:MAG: bifunctional (p)ppGpp synthetase/guanosine-3',5'-bis(diphosphate) 3'-pyrophosphohydrolase, partial [Bacteroidales bacterium]|nr:bifunctional (p)ppGpp synthetase/guanosine-3',5'-bis(diphosphate) 3'-pyrophosphohydrolase [Bacteroidales bacterium]